MNTQLNSNGNLDRIYAYNGTPPALHAPGPYKIEAFFKLSTPYDVVYDAVYWLIEHKIPHGVTIETLDLEQGFFLQISFTTDALRNTFAQQYKHLLSKA